ncbi:hypothetical protein [Burkholderia cepacia]|uniref:hypothetical protein n=1 Tax=Burkholderia cepacia TaxID=292 RepID=UPI002ABE8CA4|nr:hypothetical protein [Burkholderia cepacia]
MKRVELATLLSAAVLGLGGCGGDTNSETAVSPTTMGPVAPPPTPTSTPPTTTQIEPPSKLIPPSGATNPPPAAQYAGCMNTGVTPSYEEQRLVNVLPGTTTSFADQVLVASGFDQFGPNFVKQLCTEGAIKSFAAAVRTVKIGGQALWQAAVDRVQGRHVAGTLPQSDDRMLYWARLKMTLALRQWVPQVALTIEQRAQLQWVLERASRGQYAMSFPSGSNVKRIIISGFDPFTLGTPGAGFPSTSVRTGNPSGAVALALNNRKIALADGSTAVIQTYLLPVNYDPFRKGMQEHTLAPFFTGAERVNASITMSQGGEGQFWIENWHGRYHAAMFPDNLNTMIGSQPGVFDPSYMLPGMQDADIYPPDDILSYDPQPWQANQPEQFTTTTLPFDAMITANTGADITVPGASKPGGYSVIWHTDHSEFADCSDGTSTVSFTGASVYPPSATPTPPAPNSCAWSGGGGNYLSNESGYRNTLLRDTLAPDGKIFAGHLHTPIMTHFSDGDDGKLTDSMFESYRDTIVQQASNLVAAIAKAI